MRKLNLFKNLTLSIASLLFIFMLLEGGFRLLGYHGMSINFRPIEHSEEYGWKLKPNFSGVWENSEWKVNYQTNSQGFRDLERNKKKQATMKRIVVLGDSQAEGWGVHFDEMWQTKLQTKLGNQYEILNFGVRGYDILQEYKLFLNVVRDYEPDYVIQILDANDGHGLSEVTMGEDLRYRPPYALKEGEIKFGVSKHKPKKFIAKNPFLHSIKSTLYRSSFVVWTRRRLLNFDASKSFLYSLGLRKEREIQQETEDLAIVYDTNYFDVVSVVYEKMKQLEREDSFELMVVFRANDIPEEFKKIISANHHLIVAKLDDKEIWKYDPHPNPRGHSRIAHEIHEYFVENIQG